MYVLYPDHSHLAFIVEEAELYNILCIKINIITGYLDKLNIP